MMNEFEIPEVDNDPDSDYTLDFLHDDELSLTCALYSKLRMYHYHYNTVKVKNKFLSMTWLIATFVGLGYVLSGKETSLILDKLLVAALLTTLSSLGLIFLCFLDVVIYHRLSEAIFIELVKLEQKFPILSNTYCSMTKLLTRSGTGPVIYDGIFYASFVFILLSIADISIFYHFHIATTSDSCWCVSLFSLFLIGIEYALLLMTKSSRTFFVLHNHGQLLLKAFSTAISKRKGKS